MGNVLLKLLIFIHVLLILSPLLATPRPPKSFSVNDAQTTYFILRWEEPEYGSLYQINNYTIEQKISRVKNFTQVWTIPYPQNRMIIENLDPSTEYIIRLSSNNMYGRSEGVLLTQKTLPGNDNTQSGFLPKLIFTGSLGGGVAEWLGCWTCNPVSRVQVLQPATHWICSRLPIVQLLGCAL